MNSFVCVIFYFLDSSNQWYLTLFEPITLLKDKKVLYNTVWMETIHPHCTHMWKPPHHYRITRTLRSISLKTDEHSPCGQKSFIRRRWKVSYVCSTNANTDTVRYGHGTRHPVKNIFLSSYTTQYHSPSVRYSQTPQPWHHSVHTLSLIHIWRCRRRG